MGRKAMSIAFLSRHEHSVRNLSENTDSVTSGEILIYISICLISLFSENTDSVASGEISVVEVSVDLAFWQWQNVKRVCFNMHS